MKIHIANKELKENPITDKDLEPEFADVETATDEELEELIQNKFPGTVESSQSKANKHIKGILK
jgi:hypothetical protein